MLAAYAILSTNARRSARRRKEAGASCGYVLEAEGNNRLLKRSNGYLVAAFTIGVPLDSILRVAEADSGT